MREQLCGVSLLVHIFLGWKIRSYKARLHRLSHTETPVDRVPNEETVSKSFGL